MGEGVVLGEILLRLVSVTSWRILRVAAVALRRAGMLAFVIRELMECWSILAVGLFIPSMSVRRRLFLSFVLR